MCVYKCVYMCICGCGCSWRAAEHSVRFVTTREDVLSTIVVQKDGMLTRGADICVLEKDGSLVLARTVASQDPRELAKRDYGKSKRPTRVGMLPIKLTKMMINLAGQTPEATVLDPFVGSGTVLIELLLDGYDSKNIAGSDNAKRAIDHTNENILEAGMEMPRLEIADARHLVKTFGKNSFDAIVSEGHLGLPQNDNDRERLQKEMTEMYRDVLTSFTKILKPSGKIVMAFPAYVLDNKKTLYLNLAPAIQNNGLSIVRFPDRQTERGSMMYGRPAQRVHREIYVLKKA